MPHRKCDTRPGFQIALKRDRTPLLGEFDDYFNGPWTVFGGVRTAVIVFGHAFRNVGSETCVLPRRNRGILEQVYKSFRHSCAESNNAAIETLENWTLLSG